jgi:hypothetical protein
MTRNRRSRRQLPVVPGGAGAGRRAGARHAAAARIGVAWLVRRKVLVHRLRQHDRYEVTGPWNLHSSQLLFLRRPSTKRKVDERQLVHGT